MDKILIIDDSVSDRELLKEILLTSQVKYDLRLADSGASALAEIKREAPDLVLLDIHLSDQTGFDVLEALRSQEQDIPILLVSSFTGEDDRLKGLELGVTDFITKPLIPEEVKARVAVQMNLKRMQDNLAWTTAKTNEGIKQLYKELERKNSELQKMDQMKSDFVSTVSHELRTPLGISTHALSLVIDGVSGEISEKTKGVLLTAQKNLDRLNLIINDLLDISKIEEGRLELKKGFVDMNAVLLELDSAYQPVVADKAITLTTETPDEKVHLYVDKDKMIQVMNNLLNNACKFSQQKGEIHVSLQLRDEDALVSVRDTGEGIAPDDFDKLFGKFQQLSRTAGPGIKGTGLGLAICKSLVQLHGGKIWATSRLGQGTTFYFTLPSYDASRRLFDRKTDESIQKAVRTEKPGCLIMVSEKRMSQGSTGQREAFTEIITQALQQLQSIVTRPQDEVFLYDLNTIYVLLPDTDGQGGMAVIEKMVTALSEHQFVYNETECHPEFRFGLAVFPKDARGCADLIKKVHEEVVA